MGDCMNVPPVKGTRQWSLMRQERRRQEELIFNRMRKNFKERDAVEFLNIRIQGRISLLNCGRRHRSSRSRGGALQILQPVL